MVSVVAALASERAAEAAALPARVGAIATAERTQRVGAIVPDSVKAYVPNALTFAGYALGLWWSVGGPRWAGLASIVLDEVDGRIARHLRSESETGNAFDWAADAALVPMTLVRFGRATGIGSLALAAAPPIALASARARAAGERPAIGSWRAGIMLATMAVEMTRGTTRDRLVA